MNPPIDTVSLHRRPHHVNTSRRWGAGGRCDAPGSRPPTTWSQRLTTDAPIGLYLGWVMIAAVANVAAAIGAQITDFSPSDGMGFAIGALIVMAALSIVTARTLRASPALSPGHAKDVPTRLGSIRLMRSAWSP